MKRNMSRRHFLKTGGLALAAMAMCPPLSFASSEMPVQKYISLRPPGTEICSHIPHASPSATCPR